MINEDNLKEMDIKALCKLARSNEDNSATPIMVVTSNNSIEHEKELLKLGIEYFIRQPMDADILFYIIKNIVNLLAVNRGISPLTKLPGNIPIQAELKKRLLKKQEFAVLYFDLDNFKAYNDTYGFLGGDEVIKQTAKIIIQNINSNENIHNFLGHIGGDDFVALVPNTDYEEICQKIILEFDKKILDFFSDEDIEKGYLEVPNRKGVIEEFPLISISVGIVEVSKGRFHNILEIGEVGAQVKHLAKTTPGSAYAINRRTPS
ncbi:MAG: diguanylate cyclase [Clostridia bacterium]|nr:diguanylate cyclase [Clostridia bacterium]